MSLILLKRLVLFLSALLQVFGLILIVYGILFLNTGETFFGSLFVILGFVTMIMAIFGFIAAMRGTPLSILVYLGALALIIRIQVDLASSVALLKDNIREIIRKQSAFSSILEPDPEVIANLEIWINLLVELKIVCWLIILAQGVGVVLAWLLYRSIRRSRLTENPVQFSVPNNAALTY